jgi:hypothetical protein
MSDEDVYDYEVTCALIRRLADSMMVEARLNSERFIIVLRHLESMVPTEGGRIKAKQAFYETVITLCNDAEGYTKTLDNEAICSAGFNNLVTTLYSIVT